MQSMGVLASHVTRAITINIENIRKSTTAHIIAKLLHLACLFKTLTQWYLLYYIHVSYIAVYV